MLIEVVVVDDEPLVRGGIVMLLTGQDGLVVVGEASNADEALALVARLRPSVVLMDLRMPGLEPTLAIATLTGTDAPADRPPVRVLALTTFNDEQSVRGALRAGADGFVVKDNAPGHLVQAIRTLADGGTWLDPTVAGQLVAALRESPLPGRPTELLGHLTPREREVLALVAGGRSNQEIARSLFLSEATVRTHVSRILMKTGVGDRASAVVLAYQSGLVSPSPR